jgi:hypothetical protein
MTLFNKCLKVLESCQTLDHVRVALQYCRLAAKYDSDIFNLVNRLEEYVYGTND